jgi:hypothetical protein
MLPLAEVMAISPEALALQESYIVEAIVTAGSREDALHVALATVSGCDMIVSWNFSHIVNYRKIPRYNAVNILQGYRAIAIYSPLEVATDEKENV